MIFDVAIRDMFGLELTEFTNINTLLQCMYVCMYVCKEARWTFSIVFKTKGMGPFPAAHTQNP